MNVSVILPIIEISSNLGYCIESIKNQTEKSIELLLITTKSIEKELMKKYGDYKIITSDSKKIESLINAGIRGSKGKYISIINQNMILDSKMYENMLFQQADICMCAYMNKKKKQKLELFSKLASIIKIDDNIDNKLFKREFVINNQFSVDKVISNKLFIYKAVATANTFGFVHDISYRIYDKNEKVEIEGIYKTFDEIIKYYKIKNLYDKNKSKLEYVCVNELLGNTFKVLRKKGDKELLKKNWEYLNNNFPNWHKNLYVKRMPGIKSISIKITNKFIYNLKSNIRW